MTFYKNHYNIFRLPFSYVLIIIFSVTSLKCGTNDSSSRKMHTNEMYNNIESTIIEQPDTLILKQLLKNGVEKRISDKDSALICFNAIVKYCLPVYSNSSVGQEKKQVYAAYYINALNNSGLVYYFNCNYDSAMHYFQTAKTWSEKIDNRLLQAESLFNIAEVHLELGNFDEANQLYLESGEIYKELDDDLSVFYCFNSLGILYKVQGDYYKALEYYEKAFSIVDSLNDESGKAFIYNNIGNIYKNRGEFSKALENFDLAYHIFTGLNESLLVSDCLNNMGDISKETGNYQRAISYYQNSLEIADKAGDNYRKTGVCKNLGEVYTIISDFGQAAMFFEKAISLALNINDSVRLASCYKGYGRFFEKQGDLGNASVNYLKALKLATDFNNRKEITDINLALSENSFGMGKPDEALMFAQNSFKVASEIGALKEKKQALKILADIYLSKGDSSKAFVYYREFSEMKDTLAAISQLETIETIEARHQLKEKENENLLLKAESETRLQKLKLNKTLAFALAFGLFLLSVIVFLLYKRMQFSRVLFQQKEELNRSKVLELNNEIDFKNRELTAKALHLVQKDEMIGSISERLQEISGSNGNANREIKSMIWEMKSDIQKNNWSEFEHHFLNVHPDFYHKLQERFPTLTANEKKICAFLKLNLKTKEISSITGQSVKSIEVARTRLRGKFNLHPDENLNAFIGLF
ncbi:MAG: tetratricopeptide repeat protein [Bacteroidetes bacterium]|nr:MAG: tetratricopeptide repeat protein [Bacteroidota bacterium]